MKVLLLSFLFFFLAGCERSRPAVKIGVVLPLGGAFEIYGSQGLNGAQLAMEEEERVDHHFNLPMYLAEFSQRQLNVIREFGIITPSEQRQSNTH